MGRAKGQTEKEKYAQRIEEDLGNQGNIYTGGGEGGALGKGVPLGKYVT